jgi:hypothetical protein
MSARQQHAGMSGDVVVACADLAGRAGARDFEIGYLRDDVPTDQAGWYAQVTYRGARLMADEHRSPTAAALALAERILSGAQCRCGRQVALADDQPGCRWQLVGKRWEPGCDGPRAADGVAPGDPTATGGPAYPKCARCHQPKTPELSHCASPTCPWCATCRRAPDKGTTR